jgi:serine/threonine-protein kinase
MAEIWKARVSGQAGFGRDVVVKRLLDNEDAELVSMFTDEARILGRLHHPNVVQAIDFGLEEGRPFLVLEYVEGPSLLDVLRTGRPVPAPIVAYVGRELARALAYVHERRDADGRPLGVVHRDVTPSNVIVTPAGAVKLLDFGIAKHAGAARSTRAGFVKGKSGYLAPELLRGARDLDGRVDVFSLGTVLHELATGRRLFAGDTDLATMKRILDGDVPTPSSVAPDVPPALDRAILGALERDAAKRTATAAALARALDDVVVESGLRLDDVARFVGDFAEPRTPSSPAREGNDLPTRRDRLMPLRCWLAGRASTRAMRRAALVAGATLALGAAGALGWGARVHAETAPAAPPAVAHAIAQGL